MAIRSKTIRLKRSTRLAKEGSFESGAGRWETLPIGILAADGRRHRAYARLADNRFPSTFWDPMSSVTRVELWGYKVAYDRVDGSGPGRCRVRRCTAGADEGTSATLSSSNGGGAVWPGPATAPGSEVRGPQLPSGTGKWVKVAEVTSLSRPWWPARLGGDGDNMLGILVAQDGDDFTSSPGYTGTGDNVELASDDWGDGSKALELHFFYDDDRPPEVPTIISPEPGGSPTVVATTSGTELPLEFDFNDADDTICADATLEVFPNAITDTTAAGTTPTARGTFPAPGAALRSLGLRRYSVRLGGLPARSTLRYRLKVFDDGGADGPWTSLADGQIKTAFVVGAPLQPIMTTDPAGPVISGTIDSPADPADYVRGWQGELYLLGSDGSQSPLWLSGEVDLGDSPSLRRSTVAYGGRALVDGDRVYWRQRHRNRDLVWGEWGPFTTTTMRTQVGPTITPGDTTTKILTRTPTLTLTHQSTSDGYQYRIHRAGALIHDSGLVAATAAGSHAPVVPSGILNFGDTFEVEAASRPQNNPLGTFSPRVTLYVDALPSTTITASDGAGNGGPVIPTTDILWALPYLDPDVGNFGEAPQAQELELRVAASPQGGGALIEKRTSVGQIVEAVRTGRTLDLLTSVTGWVADADVIMATGAQQPSGYAGNSLELQATGGASTDRGARLTFASPLDLSAFPGGTLLQIHRRISSVTNLTRAVLRFEFATVNDWAEFELVASGGTIDTWAEVSAAKANPRATSGTVAWSAVTAIRLFLDVSAAYTGNLHVRDLRIGTTRTGKSTPDGHVAVETSVDARARYRDDAAARASTTLAAGSIAGATNVKVTSVTDLVVGDWLTVVTAGAVESRQITAVGTAGAGGTGVTVSEGYAFAHGSGDTATVHFWGPWTAWVTAKASAPPTVASDTPADLAIVADPTPALAHTFSSPGGKAQASRETRLLRIQGLARRVLASGPASFWRLAETSGPFADQFGGVNGTANGTMTRGVTGLLSPADSDAAVDLDGSSGYITFGDNHDLAGTVPFSVLALVDLDALPGGQCAILGKEGTGSGWWVYITSTGAVRFGRRDASGTDQLDAGVIDTSVHVVVATHDGTTMRLYVDGLAVGELASSRSVVGNADSLTAGRQAGAAAGFLDGKVDELAVWTRALPAAEVAAIAGARLEQPGDVLAHTIAATGTGLTDTGPRFLLSSGQHYAWEKTARDTDGLHGVTARRRLVAAFSTPAAVANLAATPDPATGGVTLAWDASSDPYLDHYRVFWRDATGQLVRIDGGPTALGDGLAPLVDATFTWYGGRLGINEFVVTVHNGSLGSEGTAVAATLTSARPGSWMVAGDGEERYTFAFDPDRAPRTHTAAVETYRPPGRRYPVHRHWGQAGRHVALELVYLPDVDGDLATIVAELLGSGLAVWLKAQAPYQWDVMRARVVALSDEPLDGGLVRLSVEADEVALDA